MFIVAQIMTHDSVFEPQANQTLTTVMSHHQTARQRSFAILGLHLATTHMDVTMFGVLQETIHQHQSLNI